MTTHTPGPWTNVNAVIRTEDGRYDIAEVNTALHGCDANARLIAAAPELLEALELAMMDHDEEHIELNHDTVSAARAAIAKARG